jgi:UDPglucose 6-dehydrogenase
MVYKLSNSVFVMKIGIFGVGYVGLVAGVCFADSGNKVMCFDVDKKKLDNLSKGISPIYEEGIEELIKKNLEKNLFFESDPKKSYN